jgi:hypothetical protein
MQLSFNRGDQDGTVFWGLFSGVLLMAASLSVWAYAVLYVANKKAAESKSRQFPYGR